MLLVDIDFSLMMSCAHIWCASRSVCIGCHDYSLLFKHNLTTYVYVMVISSFKKKKAVCFQYMFLWVVSVHCDVILCCTFVNLIFCTFYGESHGRAVKWEPWWKSGMRAMVEQWDESHGGGVANTLTCQPSGYVSKIPLDGFFALTMASRSIQPETSTRICTRK